MKILFFISLIPLTICAAPTGFQLVKGDAQSPLLQGNEWVIRSGDKTIVHWDHFSIAKGETVRFDQLDRSSAILNRVVGPDSSHILGTLLSNGNVYVINPHGLLIGPDACIEVASFIGSSLDVLDQDFLEQKSLLFSGPGEGMVVNLGTIQCDEGLVALIGRVVKNEGSISAKEGNISLAVGSEVLLQLQDRPTTLIKTYVQGDQEEGSALIQNGTLEAFQIELKSGSSIYSRAIQCSGVIEASSIRKVGGKIELFAPENECLVEGKLFAKNEEGIGGEIHILGKQVHLHDHAEIDASGSLGGGQILIGGDYQGSNPNIPNAKQTFVDQNVYIKADALDQGNGGRIIVWSDDATVYLGNSSARGGTFTGDGGFIEVSGKRLDFNGTANLSPSLDPSSKVGTLLLDPTDIVISTGGDSGGSFGACAGMMSSYTPSGAGPDVINTTTLVNLLNTPCNVTISNIGSTGGGTGTITVSNPVSWSAATTLTLISHATLTLNAAVSNTSVSTGFTAIDFQASPSGTNTANTNGIVINGAGSISTLGGNINLVGRAGTAFVSGSAGIIFVGGSLNVGSGATATVSGTGGGTSAGAGSTNFGISLLSGSIVVNDGATLTLNGTGGGFPTGGGSGNRGIFLSGGSIQIGATTGATVILSGTGGPGSGGSTCVGVQMQGTAFTFNGASTLRYSNCNGGGTDGGTTSNNYGILFNSSLTTTTAGSKIQFENITGGGSGASSGNDGLFIFTGIALSAPEISMGPGDVTHIRGSITSSGALGSSNGISVSGPIGSNAAVGGTTILNLIGDGGTTNNGSCGIRLSGASAALNIADGGTMNITGYGGGFVGAGGGGGIGINLFSGTVQVGNTTGATAIFSGIGGTGAVGSHHGVQVLTGSLLLNGNSILRFSNCTGGGTSQVDLGFNYGIHFSNNSINIATAGSEIQFENISGGGSGNAPNNCGIVLNNISVSAPSMIMGPGDTTHIRGGNTSGTGNVGLFVTGASGSFGSSATTTNLSIVAEGNGTGTGAHGVHVTAGGKIQTLGTNPLALSGTAGSLGLAPSYGIYVDGASSQITSVNGNVNLTGQSFNVPIYGIVLEATGAPSVATTGTGSISFTAPSSAIFLNTTNVPVVSSSNDATFNQAVVLNTATTINTSTNNGDLIFASTVNGANALTLVAGTGTITLTGAVGGTTPLTNLVFTSAGLIEIGNNITVTGANPLSFPSPVSLTGNSLITSNGAAIDFNSTINGNFSLNLSAGAGIVSLGGAVGGTTPLTNLIFGSTSLIEISDNITVTGANPLIFSAPVSLLGSSTVTSNNANVTFSSTVNGAFGLTVGAGSGLVTFTGSVGGMAAPTSLNVTGISIITQDFQTTAGAMSYNGPVTANTTGIFTNTGAGGIFFSSTLTGNDIPITLSAPNTTIQVVGTTTTSGSGAGMIGQTLDVSADGDITMGAINALGGAGANGGDVGITSTNGSISVGTINTSGGVGGNGGDITLQPDSGFTAGALGNLPNGTIVLNGNLTATGTIGGDISLAPIGRMSPLSIASITSSLAGNNITIDGASFTMGSLEAFTVLGNLTVNTSGAITVGDLVSLDSIVLTGGSITLNARGSALLLDYLGNLNDSPISHILARTTVQLNSGVQMINGEVISFAYPSRTDFETFLIYVPSSLLLNLTSVLPIPPPSPNPSSLSAPLAFVMPLIIANTELELLLPNIWHRPVFLPWEERRIFAQVEEENTYRRWLHWRSYN